MLDKEPARRWSRLAGLLREAPEVARGCGIAHSVTLAFAHLSTGTPSLRLGSLFAGSHYALRAMSETPRCRQRPPPHISTHQHEFLPGLNCRCVRRIQFGKNAPESHVFVAETAVDSDARGRKRVAAGGTLGGGTRRHVTHCSSRMAAIPRLSCSPRVNLPIVSAMYNCEKLDGLC